LDDLSAFLNGKIETLKKNLDDEIMIILMDVGNQAVKKINKYIEDWYNDYSPNSDAKLPYERTNELKNCARYSIVGHNVRIYLDMRRIKSSTQNNGKGWQAHRSFNGEDFTYGLIDFLENGSQDGNNGALHNPRRDDFGIHFLEKTQDWVNEYVASQVQIRINALVKQDYKNK